MGMNHGRIPRRWSYAIIRLCCIRDCLRFWNCSIIFSWQCPWSHWEAVMENHIESPASKAADLLPGDRVLVDFFEGCAHHWYYGAVTLALFWILSRAKSSKRSLCAVFAKIIIYGFQLPTVTRFRVVYKYVGFLQFFVIAIQANCTFLQTSWPSLQGSYWNLLQCRVRM